MQTNTSTHTHKNTYVNFSFKRSSFQFCNKLLVCTRTYTNEGLRQETSTYMRHNCIIRFKKVSANAIHAVLSLPNTTSLLCNRLQASKASALHGKSKKAKPRFNPSFFMSSTSVKSSNLSTPYCASCSFS